jgi:molybdopterin converting factor small subunit
MAIIIIPTPLRKFTNNEAKLETDGSNVEEAIINLTKRFPELKTNILDDSGSIRQFIKIYLGDDDINTLDKGETPINDSSVISIIPAIAGGKE